MITQLRNSFNASFTQEKYDTFLKELNSLFRYPTDFPVAETPVFLPEKLSEELIKAGEDIIKQITSPEYIAQSARALPSYMKVPGETPHPEFLQIDFALASDSAGGIVPRLIELQGFPSIYGYQYFLAETLMKHFNIPEGFTPYFSGFNSQEYAALLKDIILNGLPPQQVILMEIEPDKQKTRIDFAATEALTGIKTVPVTSVHKTGRILYYYNEGKQTKIKRIYNRVIMDELLRKNIKLNFSFNDDLDVQWACHPNWFFKISKFSLPFIKSPYAPDALFLNESGLLPDKLTDYVLKPLYSFAGLGVDVELTPEKLNTIKDPENYILQQKVNYAPAVLTPDGYSKVEIRMMYLWKDKPVPVTSLIRMSKGKMMGVDFNKNRTWVGSTLAFHNPGF